MLQNHSIYTRTGTGKQEKHAKEKWGFDSFEQTSPMPEYAPVMSITFPATSSLNMDLLMERRSLKNRYAGRKVTNMVRAMGGIMIFMILWMISLASLQRRAREREREREF
jgi:hypothetical protein